MSQTRLESTDDDFEVERMDLGYYAHDLAVDSVNDLLAVASDEGRAVRLFSLDRPGSGGISAPRDLATIGTEDPAYVVRLDPYHDRLYVLTADGVPGTMTPMHVYDISSPSEPSFITTFTVPLTASLDIDPVRRLLFAAASTSTEDTLHIYDIGDDELVELDGSPIDLISDYPQENTYGFQAHYLRVEPWSARVFAGRGQGILSELIAYSYDSVVPGAATRYMDLADMSLIGMLEDGIDVDVYYEDRVSLLAAYTASADPFTGDVYLSGSAWNGSSSTEVYIAYDSDLDLADDCASDTETSNLCFVRGTLGGSPYSYKSGEGISCYDWTHGQLLGLSIDVAGESDSHFVRFEADGGRLAQVHPPSSPSLSGNYAIGLGCH
jgi:hypothetical protein